MDILKNYDPDMAQKIMDEMFVFENLIDIDDRGIQLLLREVQSEIADHRAQGRVGGPAREDLQEHVAACRGNDAGRPRVQRPGAPVRGRGAAEGNPADRAPPGRRRPDRRWVERGKNSMFSSVGSASAFKPWEMTSFGGFASLGRKKRTTRASPCRRSNRSAASRIRRGRRATTPGTPRALPGAIPMASKKPRSKPPD